jgi:hypothetical protein
MTKVLRKELNLIFYAGGWEVLYWYTTLYNNSMEVNGMYTEHNLSELGTPRTSIKSPIIDHYRT